MTVDEAYLQIVEGWLRQWRGIVWPPGCIDDLCKRITMVMQEAADEIERLRLYKEKNESLLIAAAGEQQTEVEQTGELITPEQVQTLRTALKVREIDEEEWKRRAGEALKAPIADLGDIPASAFQLCLNDIDWIRQWRIIVSASG